MNRFKYGKTLINVTIEVANDVRFNQPESEEVFIVGYYMHNTYKYYIFMNLLHFIIAKYLDIKRYNN